MDQSDAATLERVWSRRRELEQQLTTTYRFLGSESWRSVQEWFLAKSAQDASARRTLATLLDFPRGMEEDILLRLFGSDSAFSHMMLDLAARRLFFFLDPYRQLFEDGYRPLRWDPLRAPLDSLRAACSSHVAAKRLKWSEFWRGFDRKKDSSFVSSRNLDEYRMMQLDGRPFTVLKLVASWRKTQVEGRSGGADDWNDWPSRRGALRTYLDTQLAAFCRDWRPDGPPNPGSDGAPEVSDAEMVLTETAWWAEETVLWLSTAEASLPNGRAVHEEKTKNLDKLIEITKRVLTRVEESRRLEIAPAQPDVASRIRFETTPDLFSDDRTILFSGMNAMSIAQRLAYTAMTSKRLQTVSASLDDIVRRSLQRILQLRDNGHLWWSQNRLAFLYRWIDYYRYRQALDALPRGKKGGPVQGIEKLTDDVFLAPELKERVREIQEALTPAVEEYASDGGAPRNRTLAVVLMAEPGTGKSKFINAVLRGLRTKGLEKSVSETMVEAKMQHLATAQAFKDFITKGVVARKQPLQLVFLDELHLEPRGYDQYAELLPILEDNIIPPVPLGGKPDERFAIFFFAMSQYLDQWDFVRTAEESGRQAMRDFHSRVARWVRLPPLDFSPIQRMAIFLASRSDKKATWAELLWIATAKDRRWSTGRGISQAAKTDINSTMKDDLCRVFGFVSTEHAVQCSAG